MPYGSHLKFQAVTNLVSLKQQKSLTIMTVR